jgi:hypothetical protein
MEMKLLFLSFLEKEGMFDGLFAREKLSIANSSEKLTKDGCN